MAAYYYVTCGPTVLAHGDNKDVVRAEGAADRTSVLGNNRSTLILWDRNEQGTTAPVERLDGVGKGDTNVEWVVMPVPMGNT